MAPKAHVQESRFSSIFVGFLRFSSIFFGFRRFSSKTLNPVYGPWEPCTGIKVFVDFGRFSSVFVDFLRVSSIFVENLESCIWPLGAMYRNQGFRRFSLIFFGFLRFSSGFVDFRPPFSSVFFDVLRFSSVSGMDLERIWVDLRTGSEVNLDGSGIRFGSGYLPDLPGSDRNPQPKLLETRTVRQLAGPPSGHFLDPFFNHH